MGTQMNKTIFLIDGFNLYHSLTNPAFPQLTKYKWLNLHQLCKIFLPNNESLEDIFYFTSLTPWNYAKRQRHMIYIRVLEYYGIKVIYGKFKPVEKLCPDCKTYYSTYEEKQTDVNIAISLMKFAKEDKFDRALILTGDSDQVPTIKAVKELYPTKIIEIMIPFGRDAKELKSVADHHFKIKELQLQSCQLNDKVDIGNNIVIEKPKEWKVV
jgi:uncharacterized LabA/DUF88 family protein